MLRWSITMPSGCLRPALKLGLPSQYHCQVSCWEAAFLPIKSGSYSDGSFGTKAFTGQFAASLVLLEFQMSESLSPFSCVPLGSSKNAAVVSFDQASPAVFAMMPATCIPDPKTYWSGVPLGQNPPPTVVDPLGSTQMWPKLSRPQSQRLPLIRPSTPEKRFTARRAPGRGPAAAVVTASASPTAVSVAHRNPRFDEAFNIAPSPRWKTPPERPPGPAPAGRATRSADRAAWLERELKAEPDPPPRPVEPAGRVLQIVPAVERGIVLGRREHAVAVAVPRFGTLQQHAVHRATREVPRVPTLPAGATLRQNVEVDVVTNEHLRRGPLSSQQRHLLLIVARLEVPIHDIAHLREPAHDILEVEQVARFAERGPVERAHPEPLRDPQAHILEPRPGGRVQRLDGVALEPESARRGPFGRWEHPRVGQAAREAESHERTHIAQHGAERRPLLPVRGEAQRPGAHDVVSTVVISRQCGLGRRVRFSGQRADLARQRVEVGERIGPCVPRHLERVGNRSAEQVREAAVEPHVHAPHVPEVGIGEHPEIAGLAVLRRIGE